MQVIEEQIRIIKDFPKPGILFRDITTLLKHPRAMAETILEMKNFVKNRAQRPSLAWKQEASFSQRPLLQALELPYPVRKAGKLHVKQSLFLST